MNSSAQANTDTKYEQENQVRATRWGNAAEALKILGFEVFPKGEEAHHEERSYDSGPVGVRRSDGLRIFVNVTWNKTKYEAKTSFTKSLSDALRYDEPRLEIGIGYSKTPSQIAKDIQRRLLPEAEAQLERAKARRKQLDQDEDSKQQAFNRMNAALGVVPTEWSKERTTAHKYLNGKYSVDAVVHSADSVEIKINCINAERAEKILKLLATL